MAVQYVSNRTRRDLITYYQDLELEMGKKWEPYIQMMLQLIGCLNMQSGSDTIWVNTSLISLMCMQDDIPYGAIMRITPTEQGYEIIYALDRSHPSLNVHKAIAMVQTAERAAAFVLNTYRGLLDIPSTDEFAL